MGLLLKKLLSQGTETENMVKESSYFHKSSGIENVLCKGDGVVTVFRRKIIVSQCQTNS